MQLGHQVTTRFPFPSRGVFAKNARTDGFFRGSLNGFTAGDIAIDGRWTAF